MKQTIHAMLAKVNNRGWKQVKPEQCLAFEDNEQMACSHHQNDAGSLLCVSYYESEILHHMLEKRIRNVWMALLLTSFNHT